VRSAQSLATRIETQLLEPELEHIEQAATAPGEVASGKTRVAPPI